jgi:hypothetical protein
MEVCVVLVGAVQAAAGKALVVHLRTACTACTACTASGAVGTAPVVQGHSTLSML